MAKFSLQDFINITFEGFDLKLPDETIALINELSSKVGSTTYIKTPVFQKRTHNQSKDGFENKKKRNNKNSEVINDEDWERLRTFQTTKIEQKEGIDVYFDNIRSYLNKITEKNYSEMSVKIIEIIDKIYNDDSFENKEDNLLHIGKNIFEIASNNRFYSKIYAILYSELIKKYEIMKNVFENSFNTFLELFKNIEYVDPNLDYDKFCKINKDNEKRKALSLFFVNLMNQEIIQKESIINLMYSLLSQFCKFIGEENRKNEADELTENISLLFNKELLENSDFKTEEGLTILQLIEKLSKSKTKDYLSLTNKSIFKFMDMMEL